LALFYVHRAPAHGRCSKEIGLPTKKGWDLKEIDGFGGDFNFFRRMDVGCDGDTQFLADFTKDPTSFFDSGAAIGVNRSPVGFVLGRFENKFDFKSIGDFLERAGHAPRKVLLFKTAGPKNKKRIAGANGEVAKLESIHASEGSLWFAETSSNNFRKLSTASFRSFSSPVLRFPFVFSDSISSESTTLWAARIFTLGSPVEGLGILPRKSPPFWA